MIVANITINGNSLSVGRWFDVTNPATGEVIGQAPEADIQHVDAAIVAAQEAFHSWSRTTDGERKAALLRAADIVATNAEELAAILTQEQGKPLNGLGSRFELGAVDAWARYTAGLDLPVEIIKDDEEGRIERHRKPIGVLGSITPWNWPLMILCWHIIPALRAGNTVVARPSPNTPLAALRMIELMASQLPPGVLNGYSSSHIDAATHLTEHPDVDKLIFTGSSPTGTKIMSSAANTLKRLTLELGGNDAGIVLPDADPAKAAEGLFWGAFINNGQTCAALKRLYVHDDIYDQTCEALVEFAKNIPVGNGLDESSILGPVQNARQREIVDVMVREAVAAGAKILIGGQMPEGGGYFYPVTLVAEARHGMRLVDEEQFGPALPVIRYTDLDQVIAESNQNPNGLGGSVWTNDHDAARRVALQMQCGSVWWNQHGTVNPAAPFGGIKSSGIGVQFGSEGLHECTTGQTVFL